MKTDTSSVRLPADGPSLKLGSEHPQVVLLRQRLGLPLPRGAENIYDLEVQDAVKAFQQQNNIQATGILTPRTRSALNAGVKPDKPAAAAPAGSDVQRLIVNMERWRWVPEHLGEFHIEDNLPGVHDARLQEGPGHPFGQDRRRQGGHAAPPCSRPTCAPSSSIPSGACPTPSR